MSDLEISRVFDDLEALLDHTVEDPDPLAVAAWHERFKAALAQAERGPQWPELQARGQALGAKLNQKVSILRALQADLKHEMEAQGTARRALSAYAPSNR